VVAILVLIVLATVLSHFIFLSPCPKICATGSTITVPAPFHVGRSFIDYIDDRRAAALRRLHQAGLVAGLTLRPPAGWHSHGLGHTHGIASSPAATSDSRSDSGDNTVGVFDLKTQRFLQKIPAASIRTP